jgi:uncharacterized protein YbjT (DUF2867 family)
MDVAIAGAHGRTGLLLGRMLAGRGDAVRGLIRDGSQAPDLEAAGVEPVVGDLAGGDLRPFVEGADAVVFAAAGGSGAEQRSVDQEGAGRLAEAAREAGVRRYVLLSANGAHDPYSWGSAYAGYLSAKAEGEREVRGSGLDWTVVRPGSLTNGAGTGRVTLLAEPGGSGSIAREDVARTLMAVLDAPNTVGATLELWGGRTPIEEAVRAVRGIAAG